MVAVLQLLSLVVVVRIGCLSISSASNYMPYSGGEEPEGVEKPKRAKGDRIRTGEDVGNFS